MLREKQTKMTLKEVAVRLGRCGIENPAYEARELFMYVGKMSREELISGDAECESPELCEAVMRREKREPLQYIIGEVGFYRETYKVSDGCLIPRSDTEILVDYAVRNIPSGKSFLDLCTGSGCVALSTLKNTHGTTAYAVDISRGALKIAKENATKNGVEDRLTLIEADAREPIFDEPFFAVLSNPPYVTEKEYESLEPELYFEPRIALVGNDEGLEFYKTITNIYKDKISPEGFIAYEIGASQADALRKIAKLCDMTIEIIKDFSENDRVAILKNR